MANPKYQHVRQDSQETLGDVELKEQREEVGLDVASTPRDGDAGVEVRVLDVKNGGAATVVVVEGPLVRDLMAQIEAALEVPVARQRLIAGGKQLKADDDLAAHKIGKSDTKAGDNAGAVATVHLMRRSEEGHPPGRAGATTEDEASTNEPLRSDVDALSAALFGGGGGGAPGSHGGGGGGGDAVTGRPPASGRAEATIRTAARVRLLSSLLALYFALSSLAALTREDGDTPAKHVIELGLNLAGLYVGFAGLKASRELSLPSADRYDRGLRLLALGKLSYDAYYRVVVPVDGLDHNDDDDDLVNQYLNGGTAADSMTTNQTAAADGTSSPPSAAKEEDTNNGGTPNTNPPNTANNPSSAESDDPTKKSHDFDAKDDDQVEREAQVFSGFVYLFLWSGIWLMCVSNSARLRNDLRAYELELAADANLPHLDTLAFE